MSGKIKYCKSTGIYWILRTMVSSEDTKMTNAYAHIQREGKRNMLDYNMYLCYRI